MEKNQNQLDQILQLLAQLEEGDFSVRGKISEQNTDYNDVILSVNKLAKKLQSLYESGKEFENKINEIIDTIVAFASLDYEAGIKTTSRNNLLFPVTTGLNILGKELSGLTMEKIYFDAILKALPDMLLIINQGGIIETINPVVTKTLGYTKHELLEKPIKTVFNDDYILFQGATRERIISKGVISNLDKFFIAKDKKKIPVSFSASIILNRKKEIKGYVCIAHNMTEYKRNEKILNLRMKELTEARSAALNMMEDAYEASKSKTVFLTNMSHELRTPMSAIIGISQIIGESRSNNLNEEQKEGIEIINQSGKRLLTLINDILDLSKIEVGKMEIKYSKFSLTEMIENLEKILKNLIGKKEIRLNIRIDTMIPEEIIGDEKKLNQILINIAGNAVKFTDEGQISLKVYLKAERLYFEITDTGIGIKKDELQYIFDEFKQLDGSKSRKYEGTGLGLSLCKKMIQLLSGKITADSELRKGTTITFHLPYLTNESIINTPDNLVQVEKQTILAKDTPRTIVDKNRPLILITDDEEICQFTAKIMLQQYYKLIFAKTGIEAVEKYFELKPQVVLMDIMMPEMDGYTAFNRIRERDKDQRAPIIAVTARAMEEDREKILKYGFDDYISKPFDVRLLYEKVKKFINSAPS